MQDKKEKSETEAPNPNAENQVAQNPNPRANENIRHTSFDRNNAKDSTPDAGSEITDGEAG